jgi:hypothetical protein
MLCQRERMPKGLYQPNVVPEGTQAQRSLRDSAKGNTNPKVFNTSVQILILASVQIVCNIVYVQVQGQIHKELRCEI